MKKYYLEPMNSQKSFYKKAVVFERPDGSAVLRSYSTDVCGIDADGNFHRFWGGWSVTTQKHVNSFLAAYGIEGGGKAWWCKQAVERFPWVEFYIGTSA